tara:strand:- start:542 stop:1177 length:636 start_codon:yes stop_codon:yes gene_type:complete
MGTTKIRVISVLHQKKRKNRYSIRLSNGEVFGISENVLLSNPVHVGNLLDYHAIERLIELEGLNKVRESALSLISYRMRSKKELALRLHRKGFTTIQIESTIVELEEKGLIDDEKFGLFFARDNVKRSLLGPVALKHRLKSHFSSFEIIEKICNNIYQEFPIDSLIRDIINKHSLKDLKSHSKNKKRLINKLKRKGYCWNDIEPVLKYYNL